MTPRVAPGSGLPPRPRSRRTLFVLTGIVAFLAALGIASVLVLPRAVEGIARHELERWSTRLGGALAIDGFSLRSSSEVALDRLTWKDGTDWELRADDIRVEVDVLAFLLGGRKFQRVTIDRVTARLGDPDAPLAGPEAGLQRLRSLLSRGSTGSSPAAADAPAPYGRFRASRLPDLLVADVQATAFFGRRAWTVTEGRIELAPSREESVLARRRLDATFSLDPGDGIARRLQAEVVLGAEAFETASLRLTPPVVLAASLGSMSAEGVAWAPGEVSVLGPTLFSPDRWTVRAERLSVRWDEGGGPASPLLLDRLPASLAPAARRLLDGRILRSLEVLRPSVDVILAEPAPMPRPAPGDARGPAATTTGRIVAGDAPIRVPSSRAHDLSREPLPGGAGGSPATAPIGPPVVQVRIVKTWQDALERLASLTQALAEVSRTLPDATLAVHGATVRTLEPGQATVRPGQSLVNLEARIERAGQGPIEASLRFECPEAPADANEARVTVDPATGDLKASVKAAWLPLFPFRAILPRWFGVRDAVLRQSDWTLGLTASSRRIQASGTSRATGLVLDLPSVASSPIHVEDASAGGTLALDGASGTVDVDGGTLTLGRIVLPFELHAASLGSRPRFALKGRVERLPAQDLVHSIPREILASLDGMQLAGTFAATFDLDVDTSNLDAVRLDVRPDVADMTTVSLGRAIDLDLLRSAFLHRIEEGDGTVVDRLVGEATPEWVPLAEVPPYLVDALTTAEDASFFEHKGFSQIGIRRSFKVNLERGGFYQGASTLSQQLVKNLFLSREKTLSRKLQEVFLTWQMEQSLTKEKILELYLNVIEWGPDLWGLREAAGHYFAKRPSELTLLESAYLVSIIPNPRKFHKHIEEGAVPPAFERRVKGLLVEMQQRKRIDPESVAAALEQHIRFAAVQPPPERPDGEPPDEEYGGE